MHTRAVVTIVATLFALLTAMACGSAGPENATQAEDTGGTSGETADPRAGEASDTEFPRVRQLADDVYSYEELGGDEKVVTTVSLFVVTSEGVLVADGQGNPEETGRLVDEIGKITDQPIKHVVICSDHGDHTAGNIAFPQDAIFYAHPTSQGTLAANQNRPDRPPDAPPVVMPTTLVEDRLVLQLGEKEIQILFLGRAHTGGDLNVYLPEERILFMSEAYFNRVFPAMRSAFPSEWLAMVDRAQAMEVEIYVPGSRRRRHAWLSGRRGARSPPPGALTSDRRGYPVARRRSDRRRGHRASPLWRLRELGRSLGASRPRRSASLHGARWRASRKLMAPPVSGSAPGGACSILLASPIFRSTAATVKTGAGAAEPRWIGRGIGLVALVLQFACAGSDPDAPLQLSFGHVGAPESPYAVSAEEFARRGDEQLGGRVQIQVFGSSQLGGDEVMLQKVTLGTLDLALPSTVMSSTVAEFGLFELPYLVQDREHMRRIESAVFWDRLAPLAERHGFTVLAVWENGLRHVTSNVRPVRVPEDLQGIKLRTPRGLWRVKMFQAYGANPSPMPLAEVFVALQTGVMDGQENPLTQVDSQQFQEVQQYLSLTGHVYTPAYLTAGSSRWSALPADLRAALTRVARGMQSYVHQAAARLDAELLEKLRGDGMQVNEIDRAAFRDASSPIYSEFAARVPAGSELVDAVLSIGGA